MKLSDIGPGLLLAATGIGVGDMVSSTIAGAEYGLTLVWALVAGVLIKFAITEGAARWQSYAVREEWTFPTKAEKSEKRREAELYFSGKRIDEPRGRIRKRIKPKHAKKKRGKK